MSVTVIGDGAVGLLAVLSAKQRGAEGIQHVRELTGGHGTHAVLEAVGHIPAYEQAYGVVRPGGVISRVGAPQYIVVVDGDGPRRPVQHATDSGHTAVLAG